MSVAIRNLTPRPIFVPLNSGTNLRLSPGEISAVFHDVELKANPKIDKLLCQRAITVERAGEESDAAKPTETEGGIAEPARQDEGDSRPRGRKTKVDPAAD